MKQIGETTVNLAVAASKPYLLAIFDEAHPDARGFVDGLTGEALGAGPRFETPVIVGIGVLDIAMRAPTILVFGTCEVRTAAQLLTAGKAAGVIRMLAVAQRSENVAAADLVAEEMRRR